MAFQSVAILKNKWLIFVLICLVAIVTILAVRNTNIYKDPCNSIRVSEYDKVIVSDNPVLYLPFSDISGQCEDSFQKYYATLTGILEVTTLPNGDNAFVFNGRDSSVTVEDNDALSITTSGQLTLEAWLRPDTIQFNSEEGSGYVHWIGKGENDNQEYLGRIYSYTNEENRPNRISGYVFNPDGGLGVGSYFQEPITTGEWIHYVLVVNTTDESTQYPMGYTKIYRNGLLEDQDSLEELEIVPVNGTAPFRIGTRDFNSYFEGAIGKVAIYDYELTESQILVHYQTMIR